MQSQAAAATGVGNPQFCDIDFQAPARAHCMHVECARSSFKSGDGCRTPPPPPLRQSRANSSLPSDPHLCAGVLRGGAGGGIQQTQEPLPQPDARCRRHTNSALPAAQDRHGGESPEPTSTVLLTICGTQMSAQAQICPGLNTSCINSSQFCSCDALNVADSCCRTNCSFA